MLSLRMYMPRQDELLSQKSRQEKGVTLLPDAAGVVVVSKLYSSEVACRHA